jgi:hypothetical protein
MQIVERKKPYEIGSLLLTRAANKYVGRPAQQGKAQPVGSQKSWQFRR